MSICIVKSLSVVRIVNTNCIESLYLCIRVCYRAINYYYIAFIKVAHKGL